MSTPWEIADQAQKLMAEAAQARQQAAAMLARAEQSRAETTGWALWCSTGLHSFGQQDRKRATFTLETIDEDTGEPITERHLMCGPCADKRRGAFQPGKALPASVTDEKGRRVVDADTYDGYMKWLEQQVTGDTE